MAVENFENGQRPERAVEKKIDTGKLAAKLAPPEESGGNASVSASHNDDSFNVDTGSLNLPKGVLEQEPAAWLSRPAPVVVFLVCVAGIFILIIAYLISSMPVK
ncbi:MAG: hypothetical protein H0V88_02895 [Pyrinomonadaceae bacterium]|nr:hypothetical protein [Pyrinomonadaceae bacterium]